MEWVSQFVAGMLLVLAGLFGGGVTDTEVESNSVTATTTAAVLAVYDGDTILVELADGAREEVRYIGIDTPERGDHHECYAEEATARNIELVQGKEVVLVADDKDRDIYKRLLRYVYVDDVFVNKTLVEEGYATTLSIPPNTDHAALFASAEAQAHMAETGLWGACE